MILRNVRFLADYGRNTPSASIKIRDDSIESVAYGVEFDNAREDAIDLEGSWVLPGCIDPHVHVRDLGQHHKETWASAGAAALAGGYTTIFDMPNTQPPTNNMSSLERKRDAAAAATVDYRFWIGATQNNLPDLRRILSTHSRDVAGIKVFLAGSSSNEIVQGAEALSAIMQLAGKYGVPVAIHQEIQQCLDAAPVQHLEPHARNHGRFRPRECVVAGAELALRLAAAAECTVYLLHVSTSEEVELLRQWKGRASVFGEATPHHLFLDESLLDTIGNVGKVNPPLRTKDDCSALGSDHAPHSIGEKSQSYLEAPSGFPGLETTLALLLNAAANRKLNYERLVEVTSTTATRLFELSDRNQLTEGKRADLTIVDPHHPWTVHPERFRSQARYSPFSGMKLRGRVVATVAAGIYPTNTTEGTSYE